MELLRQYASQAGIVDNLNDTMDGLINGEFQFNPKFNDVYYTATVTYKNKFSIFVDLLISLFDNSHQIEFRKISVAPLHQTGKFK